MPTSSNRRETDSERRRVQRFCLIGRHRTNLRARTPPPALPNMPITFDTKLELREKIAARLSSTEEIRPFPVSVTRLYAACQDPETDIREFESIIECDAVLSAKLLKFANSPLFCASGGVKRIAHAVSLLGMRRLKSLATSVAGAIMFAKGQGAEEQRVALWRHSVGCAVVAQQLAWQFDAVDESDAFLAGIFHDIGKLLFYDVIPHEYSELEAYFSGDRLAEEEGRVFGTNHAQVGLKSAASWKLPLEIRTAIGWHHEPSQANEFPGFAKLISVADKLARQWGIGSDPTANAPSVDIGVYGDKLQAMEAKVREAYAEIIAP